MSSVHLSGTRELKRFSAVIVGNRLFMREIHSPSSLHVAGLGAQTCYDRESCLPNFSNLKNLETIEFYYRSQNNELASLRNLQTLKEMILFSCTNELIKFSGQLKNLNERAGHC